MGKFILVRLTALDFPTSSRREEEFAEMHLD